ncbi:DUF4169 family protein [Novosphingobium sp.]|uniref:DUF4169 family protein n=1 Tax=Novosphingobium sp. TaxID=1874826 RepID=UPI0038B964B8
MAEVINLRLARKAKARAGDKAQAAANRAKFGRTAGERTLEEAERARAARLLDGARRDEPQG